MLSSRKMVTLCLLFISIFTSYSRPETVSTNILGNVEVGLVTTSECSVTLNDTGEVINLQPLQRTDGYPRFTASYKFQDSMWNYTFNPCVPYTLPVENPHGPYGDQCHSVSMCKYQVLEKKYYYALGVQNKASFKVYRDMQNKLLVQLHFKGVKSMRHRETILKLICDRTRLTAADGLFRITRDFHGNGEPLEAELHHICCCPDGCGRISIDSTMLVLVGTVITLLFVAAAIGCLCYVKRTHLVIYSKLPGLHISSRNKTVNGPSSIEQGLSPNTIVSQRVAYRDYEAGSTLRQKLLPVLDDAIIAVDSVELGQRLGGGIFGDTHIATWQDRTVAVKRLTINVHDNQVTEDTVEFMKSEVWFLSRQRHKNIVTVVGLCLGRKHPCIITEYINGDCLRDFIKVKHKDVTWPQRIRMCNHVADGMAFLHSNKPPIIHRDLRAGNLFLLEDDVVKVADYGLIKLLQPVRKECSTDDCCCQRQYSACPATFRWTSPELLSHPTVQEDDAIITTACDVYSFGVVMWELVSAADPYNDLHTEQEVMEAVLAGQRPELPSTAEMMPQYKELMKECWSHEAKNRSSFKQVAIRLKEISHQARSFQKIVINQNKQQEQGANHQ